MPECGYMHMRAASGTIHLELELQTFVSHLMLLLGTEARSSARTSSALTTELSLPLNLMLYFQHSRPSISVLPLL